MYDYGEEELEDRKHESRNIDEDNEDDEAGDVDEDGDEDGDEEGLDDDSCAALPLFAHTTLLAVTALPSNDDDDDNRNYKIIVKCKNMKC